MRKREDIIKKGITIVLLFLGVLGYIWLIYMISDKEHIETKEAVYRKLPDGTLEFSQYKGDGLEVNIPEKVRGREVTKIGRPLHPRPGYRVHIPDTVTYIGMKAFEDCWDLTITGGKNIEWIGDYAFRGCSFAEPFPFSDNLKYIGSRAFAYAENLGEIHFNEHLRRIDEYAFYGAEIKQIEISPNTHIGELAFGGTKWLEAPEDYLMEGQDVLIQFPDEETVVIPKGIRTISKKGIVYYGYEKVKNIYITPGVQTIVSPIMAYPPMGELNIYIPASVTNINGEYVSAYGTAIIHEAHMEEVTFIVEEGSYAEEYAKKMSELYQSQYQVVDKIDYPQ